MEISIVEVIDLVANQVKECQMLIASKKLPDALGSCIACKALMGLIFNNVDHLDMLDNTVIDHLKTCLQKIQYLLNNWCSIVLLSEQFTEKTRRDSSIFESPAASESLEVGKLYLSSIIGCNEAKRSLLENLVIPFTIPRRLRLKVFSGARSSISNIILFGPPGNFV